MADCKNERNIITRKKKETIFQHKSFFCDDRKCTITNSLKRMKQIILMTRDPVSSGRSNFYVFYNIAAIGYALLRSELQKVEGRRTK